MIQKELVETFIDEMYSNSSKKNYETIETFTNHFDRTCSLDLVDFLDSKSSTSKGYSYNFDTNW